MAFTSSSPRSSAARRLALLAATAALVPGLAACGGDDSDTASTSTGAQASSTAETTPPETATEQADAACRPVEQPQPSADEPDLSAPKPARLTGSWTVTMTTNCGSFTIALDTKRQPKTSASFKALVADGFYDGLFVTRIAPGPDGGPFIIQAGDPTGTGAGGPGYSVEETPPSDAAYTRGVVAMAKTPQEPNGTSGSQFFVVTGADSGLPPEYAIVGKVTKGLDTVNAIDALGSGTDGPPSAPIVISKATAKRG